MLEIYLVRHAESTSNKLKKIEGSTRDADLTLEGIEQSKKLQKVFENEKITAIYCSDLKRAYNTAQIINEPHKLNIIQDQNLREFNGGDWAKTEPDPIKKWNEYYDSQKKLGTPREEIRPPNGENQFDHQKRIKKFLDLITGIEGKIIVVGHSGTNKVFIGTVRGTDPEEFYSFKQYNCCINEIRYDGKNWEVLRINDTAHLI